MADERKTPESENADLTVMFKKRHVVRKGNKRKVKSDDDSSDESDPGTQAPRGIKRNKTNVPVSATSLTNIKASSFDPEGAVTKSTDFQVAKSNIDDATKQSHWFDDQSRQPKATIFGPAKAAPANVRITTMFDYAPDVCKDVSPPPAISTYFPVLKLLSSSTSRLATAASATIVNTYTTAVTICRVGNWTKNGKKSLREKREEVALSRRMIEW